MKNVRKLLGHLHTVAEQYEKNLMPVINLAPLWGPNMLIVDGQVGTTLSLSYIFIQGYILCISIVSPNVWCL